MRNPISESKIPMLAPSTARIARSHQISGGGALFHVSLKVRCTTEKNSKVVKQKFLTNVRFLAQLYPRFRKQRQTQRGLTRKRHGCSNQIPKRQADSQVRRKVGWVCGEVMAHFLRFCRFPESRPMRSSYARAGEIYRFFWE